jgi:hypothetical protein
MAHIMSQPNAWTSAPISREPVGHQFRNDSDELLSSTSSSQIRTVPEELARILRTLSRARLDAESSPAAAHLLLDEAEQAITTVRAHIEAGGGLILSAETLDKLEVIARSVRFTRR